MSAWEGGNMEALKLRGFGTWARPLIVLAATLGLPACAASAGLAASRQRKRQRADRCDHHW